MREGVREGVIETLFCLVPSLSLSLSLRPLAFRFRFLFSFTWDKVSHQCHPRVCAPKEDNLTLPLIRDLELSLAFYSSVSGWVWIQRRRRWSLMIDVSNLRLDVGRNANFTHHPFLSVIWGGWGVCMGIHHCASHCFQPRGVYMYIIALP